MLVLTGGRIRSLALVCALLLAGACNYQHEQRRFRRVETATVAGGLYVVLRPTIHQGRARVVEGSPYELLIAVEPDVADDRSVHVDSLMVQVQRTGRRLVLPPVIAQEQLPDSTAGARAGTRMYFFRVSGLDLAEESYVVSGRILVDGVPTARFRVVMQPEFTSERRNRLIDGIFSV